jgi:hypothetical protein
MVSCGTNATRTFVSFRGRRGIAIEEEVNGHPFLLGGQSNLQTKRSREEMLGLVCPSFPARKARSTSKRVVIHCYIS